ncbi:hypothetical protein [Nocardiopsis sp. FR26]|uniref:hypothetical protein n=1 Tax=Nocardiopsis sp. FR26 TaxID=2605987 RepID=UPI0019151582|nr:hypothetical protein [Nocardiopsis sp. FR26]
MRNRLRRPCFSRDFSCWKSGSPTAIAAAPRPVAQRDRLLGAWRTCASRCAAAPDRPEGSRRHALDPGAACARTARDRTRPVALPVEHSVWAATGYGTLTDDLVERIQRGDHRVGPSGR